MIQTKFTNSVDQSTDIMTKALQRNQHDKLLFNLGVIDLYNVNLRGNDENQVEKARKLVV